MTIFIDCGTNLKQGMQEISLLHDNIEKIYSFEANTKVYDFIDKNDGVCYFNFAVSDKTGFTEFYIEKDHYSENKDYFGLSSRIQSPEIRDSGIFSNGVTSIVVNGTTFSNVKEYISDTYEKIIVPKIRLVDFIDYLNVEDNTIILKLDIEGEEYSILEDMKRSNSFRKIKKLYVEFHENTRLSNYDNDQTWVEYFQKINLSFTRWK